MFRLRSKGSDQVAVRTYLDHITLLTGWCLLRQQVHLSAGTRLVHYVGLEDRPAALRVHPSQPAAPRPKV